MSEFSTYLKALINESGEKITSIAQNCGLERTSISKALSDKRNLPYPAVRKLAAYFQLPMAERKKFFALYDLSLQGKEAYQNRQAVCDLLDNLAATNFHMPPLPESPAPVAPEGLVRGEYAVRSTIQAALFRAVDHTGSPEIFAYLPDKLDLTEVLLRFWINGEQFRFTELLCMKPSESHASENLALLKKVIPLSLVSRDRYHPYYYFMTPESAALSPLNYYIILPDCLIQIADDLSLAQVQYGEEIRSVYRSFFQKLLDDCDPLSFCNANLEDIMKMYIAANSPKEMKILSAQPCLGRYYTPELVQKYYRKETIPSDQVVSLINTHFSILRNIHDNFWTVFSEKGLRQIADTCTIAELPPEYVLPIEPQDMRQILKSFRDEIESGAVNGILVRPSALNIPDYLEIDGSFSTGIHITTNNYFLYGAYCCDLQINASSLSDMFIKFIEALPGSPLVYSTEETLQILDSCIASIGNGRQSG